MEIFNEGDRKNWLTETATIDNGQYKNLVGVVTFKTAIEQMRTDGLLRVNAGDAVNFNAAVPGLGDATKGKVYKDAIYQNCLHLPSAGITPASIIAYLQANLH